MWCPLGQGLVNKRFFATLAASSYSGAICQHHEYELGKTPAENVAHFKRICDTAGLAAGGGAIQGHPCPANGTPVRKGASVAAVSRARTPKPGRVHWHNL